MNGFDFSELEELQKDVLNLAKEQFPKETKKFVIAEAKKGKELAKSIAQREIKTKSGNYLKSFKTGKSKLHYKFSYKFYNDAPHGHLIEDGHNQYGGKNNKEVIGFIEGKKIFTKAQVQMESEFANDVENFIAGLMDKELK